MQAQAVAGRNGVAGLWRVACWPVGCRRGSAQMAVSPANYVVFLALAARHSDARCQSDKHGCGGSESEAIMLT